MDSIPIVSQLKSLIQAICGDVDGARQTQENFSRQALVISQIRSAVEAILGDQEAARRTQIEFLNSILTIIQASSRLDQTGRVNTRQFNRSVISTDNNGIDKITNALLGIPFENGKDCIATAPDLEEPDYSSFVFVDIYNDYNSIKTPSGDTQAIEGSDKCLLVNPDTNNTIKATSTFPGTPQSRQAYITASPIVKKPSGNSMEVVKIDNTIIPSNATPGTPYPYSGRPPSITAGPHVGKHPGNSMGVNQMNGTNIPPNTTPGNFYPYNGRPPSIAAGPYVGKPFGNSAGFADMHNTINVTNVFTGRPFDYRQTSINPGPIFDHFFNGSGGFSDMNDIITATNLLSGRLIRGRPTGNNMNGIFNAIDSAINGNSMQNDLFGFNGHFQHDSNGLIDAIGGLFM